MRTDLDHIAVAQEEFTAGRNLLPVDDGSYGRTGINERVPVAVGADSGVLHAHARIAIERHVAAFVPPQQVHLFGENEVLALVAPGQHAHPRLLHQLLDEADGEAGQRADGGEPDHTAGAAGVAHAGHADRFLCRREKIGQNIEDRAADEPAQEAADGSLPDALGSPGGDGRSDTEAQAHQRPTERARDDLAREAKKAQVAFDGLAAERIVGPVAHIEADIAEQKTGYGSDHRAFQQLTAFPLHKAVYRPQAEADEPTDAEHEGTDFFDGQPDGDRALPRQRARHHLAAVVDQALLEQPAYEAADGPGDQSHEHARPHPDRSFLAISSGS